MKRDDDDRVPIHWALSSNHQAIVELLVSRKDFDADIQVSHRYSQAQDFLWDIALTSRQGWIRMDASHDRIES